jgi:pyruvate dehydrogenase E1 component alpha subunit
MNLAAIWKLPVIFICENNLYGFSTHYKRTMVIDDISDRAAGYGMPGESVDGQDVIAVYESAGKAVDRARNGQGPSFIECKTYRYRGHSRFEDPNYRTKEEVKEWKKRDPINLWKGYLIQEMNVTEQQLEKIKKTVNDGIEASVKFAETSPDPDANDYQDYIYA